MRRALRRQSTHQQARTVDVVQLLFLYFRAVQTTGSGYDGTFGKVFGKWRQHFVESRSSRRNGIASLASNFFAT